MQDFANNFIKNIKARAGFPVDTVNFPVYYCRIFMPKSAQTNKQNLEADIDIKKQPTPDVLFFTKTDFYDPVLKTTVKQGTYAPSVRNLTDLSGNNTTTQGSKIPKDSTSVSSGTWKDVVFIRKPDISSTMLNNQFSDLVNSSERGVFQHPESKRDFGQQTLIISNHFKPFEKIRDINSLEAEIREHEKYLKQEKFRIQHPRWNYINVSIDGPLEIELHNDVGIAFIRFNLKEVTADINDTTPPQTPEQRKLSTLEKIRNAYSKARNYAFATVAEFTATVNQLDKITGLMTTVANDVSGLSTNTVNSLNAFNRLADGIRIFKASIPILLNTPSELADKKREILLNFKNVISGNDKPTKYSTNSYNKNITLLSLAKKMLSPSEFSSDNNILLKSTDKEAQASYELMTATKHVESCTLAVLLIDDADFNSENEIKVAIESFTDVIESLTNYELFLGKDIYKNKITHKIENLTLEIIEMVDALLVIYNDLIFRLLNEAVVLSYRNTTNVVAMPIFKLLHCVYRDEYNLSDAEAEHVYFDRLCRLNPNMYQSFPYSSGLIKY